MRWPKNTAYASSAGASGEDVVDQVRLDPQRHSANPSKPLQALLPARRDCHLDGLPNSGPALGGLAFDAASSACFLVVVGDAAPGSARYLDTMRP